MSAVLRFLRFQAPWADGRKVFVLLRRTPAEHWANHHYRLMDGVEHWRVRRHIEAFTPRTRRSVEMYAMSGSLWNVEYGCVAVERRK
ncbi:MAG: hypothetical protein GY801_53295 [bacterium]|nr:hypothetical protein [bacterium]